MYKAFSLVVLFLALASADPVGSREEVTGALDSPPIPVDRDEVKKSLSLLNEVCQSTVDASRNETAEQLLVLEALLEKRAKEVIESQLKAFSQALDDLFQKSSAGGWNVWVDSALATIDVADETELEKTWETLHDLPSALLKIETALMEIQTSIENGITSYANNTCTCTDTWST